MRDVDSYIQSFPLATQAVLERVRETVRTVAPAAEECISYAMPTYKIGGKPLVHFAGYARHIGLYALPSAHAHFADRLASYKRGKGSVQFPLDAPLPWALIADMVAFRLAELDQGS